jgi:hypothetical protein
MANFKAPDFNERTAAAQAARESALEKLRSKAAPDAALIAERQAKRVERERAATERRAARLSAAAEAKAARSAEQKALLAEVAPEAIVEERKERPTLTPEEQKAARDARYAARKARKR